ncbi:hypothetical protein AALA90_17595 [Lachnospiraceae bacterium 38-10]
MHYFIRKLTITGIMAILALGVLTACTKTTENVNDGNISAEGEELPDTENTVGGNAENAEDEEGEDIGANDDAGDASSGETELMGMIENVPPDSDDTFIIAKLVVEEVDGMDLVSTDENDTKVTVVYSDETTFIKRTVQSGSENAEEKEGSAADLKENFTVEMKGSYSGENIFFATEVKIVEVVSE